MFNPLGRGIAAAAVGSALALTLSACGTAPSHSGMNHATMSHGASHGMSNMTMAAGTGLADTQDGYHLSLEDGPPAAGQAAALRFTITAPDGQPLRKYRVDQTQQLHFYAVRSDLTGFQHLHPTLGGDGVWTANVETLKPGNWRTYAAFIPDAGSGSGKDYVLSAPLVVPGATTTEPDPAPTSTTTVDGYTITLSGTPSAGSGGSVTVAITRDGQPVTNLQPYLDTYAHMTGIRSGDLAFTHLHPANPVTGDHGGPDLSFMTAFPEKGVWRLFLQFQTAGTLHTAAISVDVK